MNKTQYPDWFNPIYPPSFDKKFPQEKFVEYGKQIEIEIDQKKEYTIEELCEMFGVRQFDLYDRLSFYRKKDCYYGYFNNFLCLESIVEVFNTDFEKQKEIYYQELDEFLVRVEEWKKLKKQFDQEESLQNE